VYATCTFSGRAAVVAFSCCRSKQAMAALVLWDILSSGSLQQPKKNVFVSGMFKTADNGHGKTIYYRFG